MDKRSADRDLAQVVLQDPDAEILTERSCTRDPHYRDLAQVVLQDPGADIMTERSWTKDPQDLAQEVLQDPDADIMTEGSCTRDPHTVILHKWSYYRILAQRS